MDENVLNGSNSYRDQLSITQINIENYKELKKEQFINELNDNIKKYDNYIESNISPDGNEIGYKKIFKRIKEDLF